MLLLWSLISTLLLILSPEFLWGLTVSPLPSQSPITHIRIVYVPGIDYDYDSDTPKPPQTTRSPATTTTSKPCDYDPCVFHEVSCFDLSVQTGCLCRGISGPDKRPEPPRLWKVSQGSSGEAVVHWCAPSSTVTQYKVILEGHEGQMQVFGEASRNGTVERLQAGTKVCVLAVNKAGESKQSEESCARYEPRTPDKAGLRAGVIAGGVGFLLLLSLAALLLWRRQSCKKERNDADAEGLGNPSYSTDGTL
ncbi:LRRN4 C-terminal-like protein [Chanos chanos]|uniref:LRRN4 C-terminal-like protein n=1 Tax=Chanos chanos TaxID=29144 RepID=A0A6J2UMR2_CHACN|nr:LRRN4 C-terminal-like protein [Chanos chanos]